uniref:uncharacterized protein LOC114606852 n=1 Tax=Podarcis muralis TaxID=64176 RepID=UPI00109F19DB|nr:uncharacterized protein LOC114606852 [Podarcis muralis]
MPNGSKKGLATPAERRPSRQEEGKDTREIRDYDTLMAEIRKEFKNNEQYIEKKLIEVQNIIDKKLEGVVGELTGKVKDLSVRAKALEDSMKRVQKDTKDSKKEVDRMRVEIKELGKIQEELLDNMAMTQMRQNQANLKFRGIPEKLNENIRAKVVKELAIWLGRKEEEINHHLINTFRIRAKSAKAKEKKLPGDVIAMFNSFEIRNEILKQNFTKRLYIEGNLIIIFKEIPSRFLRRREPYKKLTNQLKKNGILYRWEFPEGISFYFKEKRFKLSTTLELQKFARRYEKDLGKMMGGGEVEEQLGENRQYLDIEGIDTELS